TAKRFHERILIRQCPLRRPWRRRHAGTRLSTRERPGMDSLIPLAVFAFVSSITPGPNNIMLTSSGLLFGFARTVPHMLGITFGFGTLLAVCAAGIGALIMAVPAIHVV